MVVYEGWQFPMLLCFIFVEDNQKWKVITKNKMDNSRFVDEESIPLVQGKNYDDYSTLKTSKVDETSLKEPDTTEATSTLQLIQKNEIKLLHCTDTWMWQVTQALLI